METETLTTKESSFGFLDLLFLILWVITAYFTRNRLCQAMMIVFCASVGANMLIKPPKKKRTFYFWGNILFILYGLIGIVNETALRESIVTTMVRSLSLNLIMVYAIAQYVLWKKDLRSFLSLVEWGIFLVAVIVLVMSGGSVGEGRLGGETEMNANTLAMLVVSGMILCAYMINTGAPRGRYIFKIMFYVAIVLLTGSRKGLIMILLAVIIINAIHGRRQIVKNIIITAGVGFILYFLAMNVSFFYDIIGHRLEELIHMAFGDKTQDTSLINRQELIEIGWDYIKKRPWTGYGYDCFKLVSGIESNTSSYFLYSHNNYIELLFGGGIIALSLYYLPILFLIFDMLKLLKKEPCMTYLLAILLTRLSVEYAVVSYYSRINAYITAIVLGCVLFCKERESKRKE